MFDEIYADVCDSIRDCIKDFELRIKEDKDDSFKLHKDLVDRLEKKLKELEEKEVIQWEAQYDPNPELRLPQHVFKRLNEKLLAEKEEIKKSLAKAKGSMPKPIDYREEMMKFTDALNALEDPNVDAKTKNRFLKNIIERIEYERPQTIRLTKEYAEKNDIEISKGMMWYTPPYKIKLKLKYK